MHIDIEITLEDIKCFAMLNKWIQATECDPEVWKVWVDFIDKVAKAVEQAKDKDE